MSRRITAGLSAAALTLTLATAGATGGSTPGKQPPRNQAPPVVSGSAQVPNTLTASTGAWTGKALKYAYQWLRCDSAGAGCSAISGASSSTDVLSTADVGHTLRVIVTATNRNGSAAATSAQTALVVNAASPPPPPPPPSTVLPPSNTSLPTISGTAQQGQTLSAVAGSWSGTTPISYTYQWQRCDSGGGSCASISGATVSRYLLVSSDVGSTIRVSVTASNSVGSATASSAATPVVTAAPSAPPTGTIKYRENWETGTLDTANWGHQCKDNVANTTTIVRGAVAPDSSMTDAGSYSGRFDLPAFTAGRTACEFLHSRSVDPNADDYYGLAVRFPANWQEPSTAFWGMDISQLNYEGINAAPLSLAAHADNVTIVVNSGDCPPSGVAPGCPYYSGNNGDPARGMSGPLYAIPKGQLSLGVWHEIIVHVRWTLDTNGVLEVWQRTKGQSAWNKTVSSSGFPTLQTGTVFNGTVVTASNIADLQVVDKFGGYRGPSAVPLSVYHDNFCRATSFDAAASCLS